MEEIEDKRTERWALEEERKEQQWQDAYGSKAEYFVQEINNLLAQRTSESRQQIKGMFLEPSFFQHYKQVDIFAVMYVVMSIYELEQEAGSTKTILEQSDTMQGLQDYMFRFRMLLYRLDFEIDSEVEEEFLAFLTKHNASDIQLGVMLTTAVMRPLPLALKLEALFERHGSILYLLFLWRFIEDHWQGNYQILSKMADFYASSGNKSMAKRCQNSIPVLPEQFEGRKHLLFQAQELLWKIMYKAEGAETELTLFLQKEKVADDIWEFLLEQIDTMEKDHYLCIVNGLLECKEASKAELTLQSGLKAAPGDELMLCLLAEQAINRGESGQARRDLDQVTHPGKLTAQFREVCSRRQGEKM